MVDDLCLAITRSARDAYGHAFLYIYIYGARGSVVVKAVCYIPKGRGFDTR
jgi:hypothetical protein